FRAPHMAFSRTRLTHRNSLAPLLFRFKHGRMVDTSSYAAFLVAAFALCITPGPDMMFIVAMGGRGGPSTGVLAAFGVACATFVHTVAAALGLSALFLTLPTLYHVLRWAGAAYLLYLAVKAF